MTQNQFDKDIDKISDDKFTKWVSDECVWVDTGMEQMYFYLRLYFKFHSCERLHNFYQKHIVS